MAKKKQQKQAQRAETKPATTDAKASAKSTQRNAEEQWQKWSPDEDAPARFEFIVLDDERFKCQVQVKRDVQVPVKIGKSGEPVYAWEEHWETIVEATLDQSNKQVNFDVSTESQRPLVSGSLNWVKPKEENAKPELWVHNLYMSGVMDSMHRLYPVDENGD